MKQFYTRAIVAQYLVQHSTGTMFCNTKEPRDGGLEGLNQTLPNTDSINPMVFTKARTFGTKTPGQVEGSR